MNAETSYRRSSGGSAPKWKRWVASAERGRIEARNASEPSGSGVPCSGLCGRILAYFEATERSFLQLYTDALRSSDNASCHSGAGGKSQWGSQTVAPPPNVEPRLDL